MTENKPIKKCENEKCHNAVKEEYNFCFTCYTSKRKESGQEEMKCLVCETEFFSSNNNTTRCCSQ